MKVTVTREPLLAALNQCASITDKKASHFAASCVLLETMPGRILTLRATDCVSAAVRVTVGDVDHEGAAAIAISARDLLERVKAMPEACKVTLEVKDSDKTPSLVITGKGSRRFTLRTFPASEMPAWPKHEGAPVAIPGKSIAAALGMVEFAMRTDVQPIAQHAALLAYDGAFVRADATDGKQSALADVATPSGSGSLSLLLHFRAVPIVRRLCDSVETLTVTCVNERALFRAGNVEFATLSVVAAFPPVRRIAFGGMLSPAATIEVARDAFAEAMRGIVLANDDVTVSIAGETLALASVGDKTGEEATDTLDAVITGTAAPRNFVCEQILSALSAAPDAMVKVEMMGDVTHPLCIKSGGATFLLMPKFQAAEPVKAEPKPKAAKAKKASADAAEETAE